jgi:lipopolysaccharide export system ATP-binding protein
MRAVQKQLEVKLPSPADGAAGAVDGALLSTEKLVKEYRQRRVVNGISITVAVGEIVGLQGPNGAGKTTTFNMVVGLVKPEDGVVRFQEPQYHASAHAQARGWA